jgi:hypothetical protein
VGGLFFTTLPATSSGPAEGTGRAADAPSPFAEFPGARFTVRAPAKPISPRSAVTWPDMRRARTTANSSAREPRSVAGPPTQSVIRPVQTGMPGTARIVCADSLPGTAVCDLHRLERSRTSARCRRGRPRANDPFRVAAWHRAAACIVRRAVAGHPQVQAADNRAAARQAAACIVRRAVAGQPQVRAVADNRAVAADNREAAARSRRGVGVEEEKWCTTTLCRR